MGRVGAVGKSAVLNQDFRRCGGVQRSRITIRVVGGDVGKTASLGIGLVVVVGNVE